MKNDKEAVLCAFCEKRNEPKRIAENDNVLFRCSKCNSLIAAYSKDYEDFLKFGRLFRMYQFNSFKPTLPLYVKKLEEQDS